MLRPAAFAAADGPSTPRALPGASVGMFGAGGDQRPRVLVVEDDATTAELYEFLLEALGYQVRIVADGLRALREARDFRPTLILSDIDLPGRDGFALAAELRADPAFGHTPMVAVSGRADVDCDVQARRVGFARFLPKPVPPDTLSRTLAEVLDRRRRQDRLFGPERRRAQIRLGA